MVYQGVLGSPCLEMGVASLSGACCPIFYLELDLKYAIVNAAHIQPGLMFPFSQKHPFQAQVRSLFTGYKMSDMTEEHDLSK
jgi:hypothetical protein